MAANRRSPTKMEFKTNVKDNIYPITQQKLQSNLGVAYFKYKQTSPTTLQLILAKRWLQSVNHLIFCHGALIESPRKQIKPEMMINYATWWHLITHVCWQIGQESHVCSHLVWALHFSRFAPWVSTLEAPYSLCEPKKCRFMILTRCFIRFPCNLPTGKP